MFNKPVLFFSELSESSAAACCHNPVSVVYQSAIFYRYSVFFQPLAL